MLSRASVSACLCVCLLLFASVLCAAPSIKGNSDYKEHDKIVLVADGITKGAQVLWDVSGDAQIEEGDGKLYVWAKPGQYNVVMTAVDFDQKKISRARFTFTVLPLVPPTPPEPPTPPTPIVVPDVGGKSYSDAKASLIAAKLTVAPTSAGQTAVVASQSPEAGAKVKTGSLVTLTLSDAPPAPIPTEGFRVLIVEDAANRVKLPAAQVAILFDKSLRDYMDSKCPLSSDQKTHEWKIWDKGVDASAESKLWQDAFKRDRKSLPWIIISTGKTGYEGPLPATVDETLLLLKKYGG